MNMHPNDAPFFRRLGDLLYCLRQRVTYQVHPEGRTSLKRLTELKDSQREERCFIIGNGPSLRQTDLTRLREEKTFGLNRVYLLFPKIGFATTYLVAVNRLVLEQCAGEILEGPNTKFIPWNFRKSLGSTPHPDTLFVQSNCAGPGFVGDVRRPFSTGATVTYAAMQIAYHMGFQTVILVGVDHAFTTQGKPHETVISQGDDPNHFSPDYFGKGFKWQLPDLESSENSYRRARQAYERAGRQILDATIEGHLNIFPKVNYKDLFK